MMKRWMMLGLLVGCGSDLPEGWEDAQPVTTLQQTPCDGNPYEGYDERVEGDLSTDPVAVGIREAHFRCEQDVEGYYRVEGDTLEILVQPVDMDPKMVASCDCLYDVDVTVELDDAPASARVYRRWDHLNDDNDPVEIGALD